ncbi:hypothetical protein EXIGLDRAFT_67071 [Exidia glandulosa HHB12029]|uniref:Nucleotide-diphospho-sugar transferase n=1 Tax=Exidia glandulosa HHB12029 TaxID=1314781 RepID=A0A165I2Y4_EXIGL|nr:hypothetical protein EXIGLDRAFT_67071 [Exidia glandulosa HHB12029]
MDGVHAPSRKVIALVCAFFVSLFLFNALLHGPPPHELVKTAFFSEPEGDAAPAGSGTSTSGATTDGERIAIVLVMFGLNSAKEGQHMLKSILMRASKAVDVHVVCSQDAVTFIQSRLDLVTRPAYEVYVQFYVVDQQMIEARAQRAGVATKHHAGAGGLMKMFLHELLPIPKVIYVDTDAFFAADPNLLWSYLVNMTSTSPKTLISFPHAGREESNGALICSCVMAMNLEAMRAAPLMPSTLVPSWEQTALGTTETWKEGNMDPSQPAWGDQGLLYAMWRRFPERFWRLSRAWDISACRGFYHLGLSGADATSKAEEKKVQQLGKDTEDAVEGMLFPGIVHYNCQEGEDSVFENAGLLARPEFGPLLTTTAKFKWVWLNRGNARLRTHIVQGQDLRFEDERRAEHTIVERI